MSRRKRFRKTKKAAEPPMNPEFLKGRLSPQGLKSAKSEGGSPKDKAEALWTEILKATEKVGWAHERASHATTDAEREHYEARAVSATATREGIVVPYTKHLRRTQAAESARSGGRTSVKQGTRKPRGAIATLINFGADLARKMVASGCCSRNQFKRLLRQALKDEYTAATKNKRARYPFKNANGTPRECPRSTLSDYFKNHLPPGLTAE